MATQTRPLAWPPDVDFGAFWVPILCTFGCFWSICVVFGASGAQNGPSPNWQPETVDIVVSCNPAIRLIKCNYLFISLVVHGGLEIANLMHDI